MSNLSDTKSERELRFERARDEVLHGLQLDTGVGVLSERTLHAVLKRYYEPFEGSREVKLGRYIADIFGEDGVIEIQTGSLYALRPKLSEFLQVTPVTVVYPMTARRKLIWVDAKSGERTEGGVARRFRPIDVFGELWKLEPFLDHPNFRLHLLMVDVDEYRSFSGYDKRGRRRRGERLDRVPNAILEEYHLERPEDYAALCPENLPDEFGSTEFAAAAKISRQAAQTALRVLFKLGVMTREKSGNAYKYRFLW